LTEAVPSRRRHLVGAAAALACLAALGSTMPMTARAESSYITLASTTSTANSGLFDHLLPVFTENSGIDVRVVAVGTGQALRLARNGDADVLLVHHRTSEEAFVADGFGVRRFDLMFNDYVIVGPEADPAGVRSARTVFDALRKIAGSEAAFVSRGDDSGTHKTERELWAEAGIVLPDPTPAWYLEAGSGMGATLNTTVGLSGYTLSDRATWTAHGNPGKHGILFQGDARLRNQYGVVLVNPERHPHVKREAGQALIDWLRSKTGQDAIAAFEVGGQQLFFPNAVEPPGS